MLEKEKEAEKEKKETGEGVEKVFEKRYKKYKYRKEVKGQMGLEARQHPLFFLLQDLLPEFRGQSFNHSILVQCRT